uniref:hypothetical protein n=1 Tax=Microbulbifer agarilyticus TaxID=260552 RepID=UPI0002559D11|nr:hypothetical protein [Microbulbifer agarilyticus]
MERKELIWKNYEKHIDLYKFYIDVVVKINAFHFAISGAIFTFYFANRKVDDVQWALALPALLSLSLVILFTYGAVTNLVTRRDVFEIRDELGLQVAPELVVLTALLSIFAVVNLVTFVGAIYVMCQHGA